MNDKAKHGMLVSITGDMLEIGKNGDITIDDMQRVQSVVLDAKESEPTTEIGKKVKEKFEAELALGEDSEYYQVEFDFDVHQNKVARPASILLAQLIGKSDTLIEFYGASPDEADVRNKAINDLSFELLQQIGTTVPIAYIQSVFGAVKRLLEEVEQSVQDQIAGHRGEIMSRSLGARNPKYQKYDQSHATYKDILNALEKAREATGNDPKDYFSMN